MRWAVWWFGLFAAYLIAALAEVGTEFVAGAVIAAIAVVLVRTALRNGNPDVRVRWQWLGRYAHIPLQMLGDAFLVASRIVRALLRGELLGGHFVRVPFQPGDRSDPFDVGREALVVYGMSAAPNTIVAEVDARGELVVHQLVHREPPERSERWPL